MPKSFEKVLRWKPWKPWALLGSASVPAVVGAISYIAARRNFIHYDQDIANACAHGCDSALLVALPSRYRAKRDRAETEQVVAFSLFSVAGAVAVAGVIAVIANQPRVQLEPHTTQPAVALVPGGATLTVSRAF